MAIKLDLLATHLRKNVENELTLFIFQIILFDRLCHIDLILDSLLHYNFKWNVAQYIKVENI